MITYLKMLAVLLLPLSFIANYYIIRGCKKLSKASSYDVFIICFCNWMIVLYAVTEILSLFQALSYEALSICWFLISAIFVFVACKLSSNEIVYDFKNVIYKAFKEKNHLFEKCIILLLFILMAVIAILIPPYNYDSMVYHCTRVAHWAQNQSIAYFSSHTPEAVASPFLAEYINLNIYVLMLKHDHFLNLLQIFSYAISGVYVRALTKKLGGSIIFMNVAMLLFYSMPIAFMEAFTTQVDVFSCLIFLMFLYFIIDFWNQPLDILRSSNYKIELLCVAILTGIGYITKPSVCVSMAVIYLGIFVQMILNKEKPSRIVSVIAFFAAVILVIVFPEFYRNIITFGSLSPESVGHRQLVETGHPFYIFLNFTKNFMMNLIHRLTANNSIYLENALYFIASVLRINADSTAISENGRAFDLDINNPMKPNCDTSVNPLIFYSFIISGIILCKAFRKKRKISSTISRYYRETLLSIIVLFIILRWENYVTRYEISYLAMMCPLIAIVIEQIIDKKAHRIMAIGIISFLAFSDLLLLFETQLEILPKALKNREGAYFLEYSDAYPPREEMIRIIKDKGYKKIGFIKESNGFEYTIWAMLRTENVWIEHVMVDNQTSKYENSDFIPDCIICIWDKNVDSFEYHGNTYVQTYAGGEQTNLYELSE